MPWRLAIFTTALLYSYRRERSSSITMQATSRSGPPCTTTVRTVGPVYTTIHSTHHLMVIPTMPEVKSAVHLPTPQPHA